MSMLLPGEESDENPSPQAGSKPKGRLIGRRQGMARSPIRPCPHLIATDGNPRPYKHASRWNGCSAQTRQERRGLRRVTLLYATLTRSKQESHCLGAFTQCEHYRPPHEMAMSDPDVSAPVRMAPPVRTIRWRRSSKKRRRGRSSSSGHSGQPGILKQMAAISVVTLLIAFCVTFFLSSNPSGWFQRLAVMFIKSNPDALGLSKEQLEKAKKAGLLKDENLKALISKGNLGDLSGADKEKLKNSSAFQNLSDSQKSRLREMFGKK